jgi:hypothetical protein
MAQWVPIPREEISMTGFKSSWRSLTDLASHRNTLRTGPMSSWAGRAFDAWRKLSLRQPFEGRQALRNRVKGLLVDGVDRHLRRPKNTRIIERADLQDHGRQARPTGQDMRAAIGTKFRVTARSRSLRVNCFGVPLV